MTFLSSKYFCPPPFLGNNQLPADFSLSQTQPTVEVQYDNAPHSHEALGHLLHCNVLFKHRFLISSSFLHWCSQNQTQQTVKKYWLNNNLRAVSIYEMTESKEQRRMILRMKRCNTNVQEVGYSRTNEGGPSDQEKQRLRTVMVTG